MNKFSLVDVFDCEAYLREPTEDDVFGEIGSFGLFYLFAEISAICIAHDDVEESWFRIEGADVFDDVGVVEGFEDAGLTASV